MDTHQLSVHRHLCTLDDAWRIRKRRRESIPVLFQRLALVLKACVGCADVFSLRTEDVCMEYDGSEWSQSLGSKTGSALTYSTYSNFIELGYHELQSFGF